MKRISLLLLIIVVFAACDNDKLTTDVKPNIFLPETEIFVQGQQLVADLNVDEHVEIDVPEGVRRLAVNAF